MAHPTTRLVCLAPAQLQQLQLGRQTSPQLVHLTTQLQQLQPVRPKPLQMVRPMQIRQQQLARSTTLRQLHRVLIDPHCVPVFVRGGLCRCAAGAACQGGTVTDPSGNCVIMHT